MSYFFDSSWLIAALVEDEPNHKLCRDELDRAIGAGTAVAAQHSLAEVFHTLTGRKGVPPEQAAELLRHNFRRIQWLALAEQAYWHCVESAHRWGVRGGAVYDLLLLRTAENQKASRIHSPFRRRDLTRRPELPARMTQEESPDLARPSWVLSTQHRSRDLA